jgi:hypothetical protein
VAARKRLLLAPGQWMPLNETFARATACVGSRFLAERDLHRDLLAGRLRSAMRWVGRDGTETCERLPPSFWEGLTLVSMSAPELRGLVQVRGIKLTAQGACYVYVRRREVDRLYPTAARRPDHDDASDAPPLRVKPGPKVRGDWPTLVAQWLVGVAAEDPKRLRNVDALVAEAQTFLEGRIQWAPSDSKVLRKKIVELLPAVRR